MEGKQTGIPLRYRVFMNLFAATLLGRAIPLIVYRWLQPRLITFTFPLTGFGVAAILVSGLVLAVISGLLTGLWISLAQWIALRPYIGSVWLWLLGLVPAWIIGRVIGAVISMIQSTTVPYAFYEVAYTRWTVYRLLGDGLVTGYYVGFLQQAFLQRRTGIRPWWGVAGLLGAFSGTFFAGANAAGSSQYLTIDPIYSAILSGLVFAAFASIPALLLKTPAAGSEASTTDHGATAG